MQMYEKIDFAQIKTKIFAYDIKALISKETGLSFRGNNLKQCPLCGSGTGQNKTSAFFAYPKTNSFNCFSCGAGGDFIKFIELYKNLDFTKTMHYIAKNYFYNTIQDAQIKTPLKAIKTSNKDKKTEIEYNHDTEILKDFLNYVNTHRNEKTYKKLVNYLTNRCIYDREHIYFLTDYNATNAYLKSKYNPDRLQKSGLFSSNGNLIFYEHRILLAHRFLGEIYTIQARTIKQNAKNKYLFTKGKKIPFNLDALNNRFTTIYIVEGAMDAITLMQDNKQAIALGSVNTTEKTIKFIANKAKTNNLKLEFLFDNDKAGSQALESEKYTKFAQIFKALNIPFVYSTITGAKDINEYYCINNQEFIYKKMGEFFALIAKKAKNKEFNKWFQISSNFMLKVVKMCILENIYTNIGIELNKEYTKYRIIDLKF